MRSFHCDNCGQRVFFENAQCLRCGFCLGFLPESQDMMPLTPEGDELVGLDGGRYRLCRNAADWDACNWIISANSADSFCLSCSLNETIPDLSIMQNLVYWRKLEQGKRRLVYSLLRLRLPVVSRQQDPSNGLSFAFLHIDAASDNAAASDGTLENVTTGHKNGKITVDVIEADDLERERTRLNLNETYRSVLGHFRHECGHYYWWQLISNGPRLDEFRQLFGDERQDYDAALVDYYRHGPGPDWQDMFVSAYASSHPWEDWAESWAHYLTIIDALETAQAFGMVVSPDHAHHLFPPTDSYDTDSFDDLLDLWLPLTYAVNSINRSAGQQDLYPFVLPGPAVNKLRFVHRVTRENRFNPES